MGHNRKFFGYDTVPESPPWEFDRVTEWMGARRLIIGVTRAERVAGGFRAHLDRAEITRMGEGLEATGGLERPTGLDVGFWVRPTVVADVDPASDAKRDERSTHVFVAGAGVSTDRLSEGGETDLSKWFLLAALLLLLADLFISLWLRGLMGRG